MEISKNINVNEITKVPNFYWEAKEVLQKHMPIMNGKSILRSITGSHMWLMDTEKSDVDVFEVFIQPTRDILNGNEWGSSCKTIQYKDEDGKDKILDLARHEYGSMAHQLMGSNINFIIGVLSPIPVMYNEDILFFLNNWKKYVSKLFMKSTAGMIAHNIKKYSDEGENSERWKKLYRYTLFAETLLTEQKLIFYPSPEGVTLTYLKNKLAETLELEKTSNLQDKPTDEFKEKVKDEITRVRMKNYFEMME